MNPSCASPLATMTQQPWNPSCASPLATMTQQQYLNLNGPRIMNVSGILSTYFLIKDLQFLRERIIYEYLFRKYLGNSV